MSGLSDDEFLARLERDVRATIGPSLVPRVRAHAAHIATFQSPVRHEKVAEDVQQEILDTHVRTVWPPCPAHPNHPLWYEDGAWRCPVDASVVIAPGELRA